eukprot:TRINITY_DN9909_c0_g1_i1.p1 TRINITY_DN9909_c0_g1~~TRINITY_DN9909_c0_g1_i1.p1  ORF type:complete len:763 (+),score=84.62 TRINITY_DN9909_c0_g1_i1:252-2540(+)
MGHRNSSPVSPSFPKPAEVGFQPPKTEVSSPQDAADLIKVTGFRLERDKKEVAPPFTCPLYTVTSTHLSFKGEEEFSILHSPCLIKDGSSLLLVDGAGRTVKSFQLKPHAANEAFSKFYNSLRRKLLQKVLDGGGSIAVPLVTAGGLEGRSILLQKKKVYIPDSVKKGVREVKPKNVKAILFRGENKVGLDLPAKNGGNLICECDNAVFLAATFRDLLQKKFTWVSVGSTEQKRPGVSGPAVQRPRTMTAQVMSKSIGIEHSDEYSAAFLNAMVRQYYEELKMRHEKKVPLASRPGSKSAKQEVTPVSNLSAISPQDVTLIHPLGRGSNGVVVHMAQWRGRFVAVKSIVVTTNDEVQALQTEASLNAQIPLHKNVLRTFGLMSDGQQFSLVMELAPKGSLLSALEANRANQRTFNFFSQLKILRGVLRGMSIIANSSIVHRDLAARNILLGPELEPKISDFGWSRNLGSQKEGQTDTDLGPIRWMAPESLLERKYSPKSDVWSFGILAIELISNGQLPYFWLTDLISVAIAIREAKVNPLDRVDPSWSKYIVDLIRPCFNRDPSKRPTFDQLAAQIDKDFDGAFEDKENVEGREEAESEYYAPSSSPNDGERISVQLVSGSGKQNVEVWQKAIRLSDTSQVQELKQLGKGEYGDVFLARWRGELVALKRIRADASAQGLAAFSAEAMLMSKMTFHRNVIKTKAFCLEPGHMCVITELASNGSLDTLLEKISRGSEPEMDPIMIYYIALSIAQGMAFLHPSAI